MPVLQYGQTIIEWSFQLDTNLKRHYVTVERGRLVLLRGPQVGESEQEALVLRRARWIREKLSQVNLPVANESIVTGSRLRYCGRTYFTEVRHSREMLRPTLTFTASRFIVDNPDGASIEPNVLLPLLDRFYRERAHEKLLARVRYWQRETGLHAAGARIRHFQSRWASCNASNTLEFHPRVMELPACVQDYVIVHELCHTLERNHTKAFWALVASHMSDWERRHQVLERAMFGDAV
ncbi:SprT family zinc-dependent metalloprotease [Pseudomonas sp. AL03]|uniref:YgjP family zinc-dependent metalloprotease n=1 Tax=Pseudomonas sp. AL03 TaxID=3042230 RepID=UPI00249AD545|nr:SprT family zinc-dependent metalloprotease [Pseudomonas sp. AL03]MDI3274314.1 SprT family zinc-dependent metalloprotease [Pseudomonas sp. AL03]